MQEWTKLYERKRRQYWAKLTRGLKRVDYEKEKEDEEVKDYYVIWVN